MSSTARPYLWPNRVGLWVGLSFIKPRRLALVLTACANMTTVVVVSVHVAAGNAAPPDPHLVPPHRVSGPVSDTAPTEQQITDAIRAYLDGAS